MPHKHMTLNPCWSNPRIRTSEAAAPPRSIRNRPGKFPSLGEFLKRFEGAEPNRRHAGRHRDSLLLHQIEETSPSANGPGSTNF